MLPAIKVQCCLRAPQAVLAAERSVGSVRENWSETQGQQVLSAQVRLRLSQAQVLTEAHSFRVTVNSFHVPANS